MITSVPITAPQARRSLRPACRFLVALALFMAFAPAPRAHDASAEPRRELRRIAFGSCNSPLEPTPVWDAVLNTFPDAWLWLGDVVYADSPRPTGPTPTARAREVLDRLVYLYARQNAVPAYQLLRQRARILGTWDDHDFGLNDAGADFIGRDEAQRPFLDFYGEPADSPRRTRPGIYSAQRFGPPGRVVQIILLDTRFFRSPRK
jgi:alkaline phosphatase D